MIHRVKILLNWSNKSDLQLHFDKRADADIKLPVDEVDEVCETEEIC